MMVNPFNLPGPNFLVFYVVFSAFVFVTVWLVQRWHESGHGDDETACAKQLAKDPYAIAALRGGRDEVVRIAVVSLLERELLSADLDTLQTTAPDAADHARRPLDKAILTRFAEPAKATAITSDAIVRAEADAIVNSLKEKGLLPDVRAKLFRMATVCAAVLTLWVAAFIKISVAASRGRHNIELLIILAILAVPITAIVLARRSRTALGGRMLACLQSRFAQLKDRRDSLKPNGRTAQMAFLAAAFGTATLPAVMSITFKPLGLSPVSDGGGGSSCGGGGCGGGGCGGGCGGCS